MGRAKRIFTTEFPFHVVQRGHDRAPVFRERLDFLRFIRILEHTRELIPVKIFSFCLMTNHFHLVLQSVEDGENVSRFMRDLTSTYCRYFNALYHRRGTLWEGRFRASLITNDEYLLACNRYVELNPIRAGIASRLSEYPWTSYHHRSGKHCVSWLAEDPCYARLAVSLEQRQKCYEVWMKKNVPADEILNIQRSIRRDKPIGPTAPKI